MASPVSPPSNIDDPRWQAFHSPQGPEVFHSVVSTHDIWKSDPFDVEEIHAEAREVFERTIARIHNQPPADSPHADNLGKIFLLRGESGAGKTHLMRAFRHRLHSQGLGWFVYLQMTTVIGHYPLYILRNLVESFSQPYDLSRGIDESGWLRLSNFLLEHPCVPAELRAELRDGPTETCAKTVTAIANHLLDAPYFVRGGADFDLVRAVLFFQRCEPAFSRLIITYLRCEPLRRADIEALDELFPRTTTDDPLEMLVNIGRLVHLFEKQSLVICLDQLEEIWTDEAGGKQRFRDAMSTVRSFTDKHPGALVVVSCLDDYYIKLRELIALDKSLIDRIESVPPQPVKLESSRSRKEVEQIISQRLECLYQSLDTEFRPEEGLFPFNPAEVDRLTSFRPRGILHACREARERSVRTGEWPQIGDGPKPKPDPKPDPVIVCPQDLELRIQHTEQDWNDFRNSFTLSPPPDDKNLAALLAWAIEECNAELNAPEDGERFSAQAENAYIKVDAPAIPEISRHWLLRIANAGAPGGKLGAQLDDVTTTAQQCQPARVPIAVRSSTFPGKPGSKIAKQIGEMIGKHKGRRSVIEDSDWRAMLALRDFLAERTDAAATSAWRSADKPLSRLPGLRNLLMLDELPIADVVVITKPKPPIDASKDPTGGKPINGESCISPDDKKPDPPYVADPASPSVLGATRERMPKPVSITSIELTRHVAFIGGTGSGKTTTALTLIENLLLRGIPAILLDRKGDLATYARPESWEGSLSPAHGPDAEARRRSLREKVDVRLYTPGAMGGRPLGIPLLPRGAGTLAAPEREAAARAAASALAGMMKYGAAAAQKLAVLSKTIATLAELEPDAEITLTRLMDFVAEEDASLINALGYLDPRLLPRVKTDLATFDASQGYLLAPGGERVNAERLFGLGADDLPPAGRTRLSIISTKFFDNKDSALFWTAQFLLEMSRFAAKQPREALQGVVLFDEADLYLPAVGKPITKEPMENALRRWRSAGLGVLLASQNPGDFDYKCRDNIRTWFVGKVTQDLAIRKMRPMLQETKTDIAAKLPGLELGQFFLVRDSQVESLAVQRSLIDTKQVSDAEILRLAADGTR